LELKTFGRRILKKGRKIVLGKIWGKPGPLKFPPLGFVETKGLNWVLEFFGKKIPLKTFGKRKGP